METQTHSHGVLNDMENFFNTYLHKKAPFHLPPNAKEFIVTASPWITLILMLLIVPIIWAAISFTFFASTVMNSYGYYGYHYSLGGQYWLSVALMAVSFVFDILALPGLFHRKLSGWYFVYYGVLISALGNLVQFNIIGFVISLVISLYILFEIKEYYK